MTRQELEHIIRASGEITDQFEFVIVGSQSILGTTATPEAVFTVSMEADIYPLQAPELADMIDGAIGEGSARLRATRFARGLKRRFYGASTALSTGQRQRITRQARMA